MIKITLHLKTNCVPVTKMFLPVLQSLPKFTSKTQTFPQWSKLTLKITLRF